MDSELGNEIYNICRNLKYSITFEVGTQNGQSSTVCVMNAIHNRPNTKLYSLDMYLDQYNEAIDFWKDKDRYGRIDLMYGVLHHEILSEEILKEMYNGEIPLYTQNYLPEKQALFTAPLIDISNISNIDVMILNGGEYTTRGDYDVLKLKNPKAIILCLSVHKCQDIRRELLEDNHWKLHKENLQEPNGWSIFLR